MITTVVLVSCGSDKTKADTNEPKQDSVVNTSDFKIKIHLQDNSAGPLNDSTVYKDKSFQKKKESYIATYEELYNKLEIIGNYENLSIMVYNGSNEIFKKNNLSVNGKVVFTKKDFDLKPINKKKTEYKILVLQNGKDVFTGKVTASIE